MLTQVGHTLTGAGGCSPTENSIGGSCPLILTPMHRLPGHEKHMLIRQFAFTTHLIVHLLYQDQSHSKHYIL